MNTIIIEYKYITQRNLSPICIPNNIYLQYFCNNKLSLSLSLYK